MNQPVLTEPGSTTGRALQAGDLALRAMLTSSVVGAICVSAQGEILTANPFLVRLLSHDSLESLRRSDFKTKILAKPRDWQHWERALATRRVTKLALAFRSADSREIPLVGDIWACTGSHGGDQLLGIFTDATAAHQVDAALQHAARAEAVNGLTSGIVHDFNNLLTVLVGNLYLVAEGVRDNPTLLEQTKRARNVAKRGADLLKQLLTFSRTDLDSEKTLDTKKIVANIEPILRHAIGSKISLKLAFEPNVANVEVSAAHLESVIVNLVINARDAIDANGEITISAGNCTADQNALVSQGLPPGDYVHIAVSDNGCGIPETIQGRIFEPFFTTKGKNRGTGLGLSMVRRFAEQHRGTVSLTSRPGLGTTIALYLPASRNEAEDSSVMTMPLKMLPTGNERILVLAHEPAVAETLEESLSILGYVPRVIGSQNELSPALAIQEFSLVVIDSSFESDVATLVSSLTRRNPATSILRVGSSADGDQDSTDGVEWLKKPFTLKDLATAVRGILDADHHG